MNRPICLVTGATAGIGRGRGPRYGEMDYGLILIGRNEEKTARVREVIGRISRNKTILAYVCDLSVLRDVRGLAARIKEDHAG